MNLPYRLGVALDDESWREVMLRTVLDCCKWDVQCEDHCVLAPFPLLLAESSWRELCGTAEALSTEVLAAERELLNRKDLHCRLGLPTPLCTQLSRLREPTPAAARVMRFDFHFTGEGWRISEVNADVPGGFIEASGFTQLMAPHYPGTNSPPDPAAILARTLAEKIGADAVVGFVHATAYSDDRQVMQFLARRVAERGLRPVLASPAHIRWDRGQARIASAFANCALDALVRFFPAEWLPALRPKSRWIAFFAGGLTPTSNPASAVLVQSKRFPLVWNDLSTGLPTWSRVLPETACPLAIHDLADWVIKPALGRVGESIGIAGVTAERELRLIHKAARRRPQAWIAQRRFHVLPISDGSREYYPSVGVFTIDGKAAGAYARVGRKPLIDDEAQDVAVLITGRGDNA